MDRRVRASAPWPQGAWVGGMIPDPHRVATAGMRPGQQPFPWTPFLRAGKGGMQWWVSQGCSARGPLGPCQPPPTPSQAWWQGRIIQVPLLVFQEIL